MRWAGSASWRFAEGIELLPVEVLYIRDAMGLAVPPGGSVPPRLDAALPERSALLDAGQRIVAGAQWAEWWNAVVAHDVRMHRGAPEGVQQHAWLRQLAGEAQALFDPPEFTSLTDRPALRAAVRTGFPEALEWAQRLRRTLLREPPGRRGAFDYKMIRAVAEETARHHRASPHALNACAVVLPVLGRWWCRFAPGAILCSMQAAGDTAVARSALTGAFQSSLAD